MVYARTKRAAADLSRAIQDGTMIKEYRAVVHGNSPEEGDWTDLLFKDSSKNKVFVVQRERKGVKKARLEFKKIEAYPDATSLVHIRLYTGRTHQIRVQFASRGFPLVGDRKYGAKDEVKAPKLFSCRLTFPYKGKEVSFEEIPDFE
jgi:23S rRNA pseudouridine1911/1915/1917 synthase